MFSWRFKRQLLYGGSVLLFILVVIALPLFFILYEEPTCFDGKQNGNEEGIDCGGICTKLCVAALSEPIIQWTRAFEVAPGVYSAVAMIENSNFGAEARNVSYTLRLYDVNNLLAFERVGTTYIPPETTFPIFESGMQTGDRQISRALFTFNEDPDWVRGVAVVPTLSVTGQRLSNTDRSPRIEAVVRNMNLFPAEDIRVVAIVSDKEGNAIGASQTVIDFIAREASKSIVFTWPVPFIGTPAQIDIIPWHIPR